jgi:hypothetical protein
VSEKDEAEGMEGSPMRVCVNCKYAGRPTYKSPCSECKGYSKHEAVEIRTNGDRIRAMSDEELARWMLRYQRQIIKETLRTLGTEEHVKVFEEALGENPDCTDIVRWLKQPAEDLGTFQAECRGPLL